LGQLRLEPPRYFTRGRRPYVMKAQPGNSTPFLTAPPFVVVNTKRGGLKIGRRRMDITMLSLL
jgi:hypothetical protein